jgi:hypothetical protein
MKSENFIKLFELLVSVLKDDIDTNELSYDKVEKLYQEFEKEMIVLLSSIQNL